MPSGLWHYEFIAQLLQGLYKNADKLPSRHTRMPTSWGFFVKNLLVGDWPILCSHKQSKDHQGQTSVSLHTDHQWRFFFWGPQVPLAAELGLWPWRLQEQAHGASARAPSRWGTQSGCRQRPLQLDNVELDSSSKAEAARQVRAGSKPISIPMLGMSLPRLPFS